MSERIPPRALEQGERAFVAVLRRRFPGHCFVVRDCPVAPDDADVAVEAGAGTAADLDAVEEADEHLSTLDRLEARPMRGERASGRNPREAGR